MDAFYPASSGPLFDFASNAIIPPSYADLASEFSSEERCSDELARQLLCQTYVSEPEETFDHMAHRLLCNEVFEGCEADVGGAGGGDQKAPHKGSPRVSVAGAVRRSKRARGGGARVAAPHAPHGSVEGVAPKAAKTIKALGACNEKLTAKCAQLEAECVALRGYIAHIAMIARGWSE